MNPAIALPLMAAGVGVQAFSQIQAGKQEAALRKQNAAILTQEAERARLVQGEQAREKRKEGQRLKARQIVLFAKGNVAPGTGTPLIVTRESQKRIEAQAQVIQEHGEFAFRRGTAAAKTQRKIGRAASRRGFLQAGSSLATGLGTIGLLKYQYG